MASLPAAFTGRLQRAIGIASSSLTFAACAMLGPAVPLDSHDTVLVRNSSIDPMQIYLVGEWTTTRLGQVDPGETARFRILAGDLNRGTVSIAAVPLGGRSTNGGPLRSPHTIRSIEMLSTDLPWLSWDVTGLRIVGSPRQFQP